MVIIGGEGAIVIGGLFLEEGDACGLYIFPVDTIEAAEETSNGFVGGFGYDAAKRRLSLGDGRTACRDHQGLGGSQERHPADDDRRRGVHPVRPACRRRC